MGRPLTKCHNNINLVANLDGETIESISLSNEVIRIASFSLRHASILQALLQAKQRVVEIRLVLDIKEHSSVSNFERFANIRWVGDLRS